MDLDTFKQQLHSLFENCDYSNMLKEDGGEEKVKFAHNCTDGAVYEIEVEPSENEFYVYQDGKQIDLFNLELVDQDGGITKEKRQMIVKDWEENHKKEPAKPVQTPEVGPEQQLAEVNQEIIANMKKQYPEKSDDEIKSLYYATMTKHKQDPETGHKL
jgi:hypothetical protein